MKRQGSNPKTLKRTDKIGVYDCQPFKNLTMPLKYVTMMRSPTQRLSTEPSSCKQSIKRQKQSYQDYFRARRKTQIQVKQPQKKIPDNIIDCLDNAIIGTHIDVTRLKDAKLLSKKEKQLQDKLIKIFEKAEYQNINLIQTNFILKQMVQQKDQLDAPEDLSKQLKQMINISNSWKMVIKMVDSSNMTEKSIENNEFLIQESKLILKKMLDIKRFRPNSPANPRTFSVVQYRQVQNDLKEKENALIEKQKKINYERELLLQNQSQLQNKIKQKEQQSKQINQKMNKKNKQIESLITKNQNLNEEIQTKIMLYKSEMIKIQKSLNEKKKIKDDLIIQVDKLTTQLQKLNAQSKKLEPVKFHKEIMNNFQTLAEENIHLKTKLEKISSLCEKLLTEKQEKKDQKQCWIMLKELKKDKNRLTLQNKQLRMKIFNQEQHSNEENDDFITRLIQQIQEDDKKYTQSLSLMRKKYNKKGTKQYKKIVQNDEFERLLDDESIQIINKPQKISWFNLNDSLESKQSIDIPSNCHLSGIKGGASFDQLEQELKQDNDMTKKKFTKYMKIEDDE